MSSDGRTVAFTSPVNGFDQVFVMLSSGGDPLQLTAGSADKKVDSFSIDGTGILYDKIQGNEVWTVPTLGGAPTRIVSGQNLITSPDGNSFYYLKPGSRSLLRKAKSGVEEELIYNFSKEGIYPWDVLVFPNEKDLLIAAGPTSEAAFLPSTKSLYRLHLASHKFEKLGEVSGIPRPDWRGAIRAKLLTSVGHSTM